MKTVILLMSMILLSGGILAQWNQTNGPPGGLVAVGAIAISGGNIIAGTNDDGMYLSMDEGASWSRIERSVSSVHDMITFGGYVFAGTEGDGTLRSADHGLTWIRLSNGIPDQIGSFAVSVNKIFAGTFDVYVSSDYGDTWTAANGGSGFLMGISALAVHENYLFAAHYDEGIFLSTDDGKSWTEISNELAGKNIIALAANDDFLFAGTWDYGVYRSSDHGASWTQVNTGLTDLTITSFLFGGSTLFAGILHGGVCKTDNQGDLWSKANTGLNDYLGILDLASEDTHFVLGTSSGEVFSSTNSGNSWNALYGLPCTWVSCLATTGSSAFAGTYGDGLFTSTNNGETWLESGSGIPFGLNILTLLASGTEIYAGTSDGVYVSSDAGNSFKAISHGLPEFAGITSLLMDGNYFFAGTTEYGIYLSLDKGLSWLPVNDGLPLLSISSLASKDGVLFAGTGAGVYTSTNNGDSWAPANEGLTDLCVNAMIIQGPNVIVGTYCEDGGVFTSSDNGNNWSQRLTDLQITALASSGSVLLASSFSGRVFVSHDQGVSWTENSDGLPTQGISALAVVGTHIFAGTYENGVFINSGILTRTRPAISETKQINPYPNPTNNTISVDAFSKSERKWVSIYNSNGQKVIGPIVTSENNTINICGLPAGLYILTIKDGMSAKIGRFIKE